MLISCRCHPCFVVAAIYYYFCWLIMTYIINYRAFCCSFHLYNVNCLLLFYCVSTIICNSSILLILSQTHDKIILFVKSVCSLVFFLLSLRISEKPHFLLNIEFEDPSKLHLLLSTKFENLLQPYLLLSTECSKILMYPRRWIFNFLYGLRFSVTQIQLSLICNWGIKINYWTTWH